MIFLIKKFIVSIFALTFFSPWAVAVDFPKKISNKKPLSIELKSEYYSTKSNYIRLSGYAELASNNQLSLITTDLSINYSAFRWLNIELFGDSVVFGSSQTDKTPRLGRSLTYSGLGLTLLYKHQNTGINFEIKSGYSLEEVNPGANTIVLSDGAHFINPNLWLTYEYQKLFLAFGKIGFMYRTDGFSSLTFYKLGAVFQTPVANIGFSADLLMPLVVTDTYYKTPQSRHNLLEKVNGGSYKFYSIHPILLSFTPWLEWNVHPVSLKVYSSWDTFGRNSAKGFTIGFNGSVIWNTKSYDKENLKFRKKYRKESLRFKKNSYYEEEPDSANQELKDELKSLR